MKKCVRGAILFLLVITVIIMISFCSVLPSSPTNVDATKLDIQPTPAATVKEEDYIQGEFFYYTEQDTAEACLLAIGRCEDYIKYLNAHLPKDSELLKQETEWIQAQIDLHNNRYLNLAEEEAKWVKKMEEYPRATMIWLYMKENFGWSDVVCAGVMGNIMGEIGRDMKFDKWNHDCPYGMFQWLGSRRKDIHRIYGEEPSIEEQLEFMYDELYGTDGVRKQVKNWQREEILNGETPEEVAMAFCRYFERPGGKGLVRKTYARTAYDYFTN